MILQTETGQAFPTAITLPSDAEPINIFAVSEDGVPVEAYWTLTPNGSQVTNPNGKVFFGGKNSSPWFGTLGGFSSPTFTSIIAVGFSFATTYYTTNSSSYPYLAEDTARATLTAVPTDGSPARQLQITVQPAVRGLF
jgi:hypothetical protein